jgi:hypothetical protein
MAAISLESTGHEATQPKPEPASAQPRVGRAGVAGAVLGFLVAVLGVTAAGAASGLGLGAAFGLSLFVGLWGGLGFGFMTGATLSLALHTDRLESHRPTS